MLSLGIDMILAAIPFGPICRAPKSTGGFYLRSTTSVEIAEFLNAALQLEGQDMVTSHMLKATTLSWAAKYGLDEPARTLLAHHQLPGDKSLAASSRDMLSRPLALYQAMLKNIRSGYFLPDLSQSGRISKLFEEGPGAAGIGSFLSQFKPCPNFSKAVESATVAEEERAEGDILGGRSSPSIEPSTAPNEDALQAVM